MTEPMSDVESTEDAEFEAADTETKATEDDAEQPADNGGE